MRTLLATALLLAITSTSLANDWPAWRYDATRSAASPHKLPAELSHHYTVPGTKRKPVWDDPLNQDLMPYDQVFEPIVAAGKLYLTHNDRDKLEARDLDSGKIAWTFYADAPIRFAPAAHAGRLYLVSDDGFLYCLDGETGAVIWRFRGGPSARKSLGNERITSAWPARGGPVVHDDTVYFAASIWPFMGTFIYAIDADSGAVQWVNDGTSADYIKQPHNAPSFAGVAPQGALAVSGDRLIVPGGRSTPAVLDRHTGEQQYFYFGGKGVGGSLVLADNQSFYVHTRNRGVLAHDLKSGKLESFHVNEPVLIDGWVIAAGREEGIEAHDAKRKKHWKLDEVDASGDLILAGRTLYAAGGGKLSAITLGNDLDDQPKLAWQLPLSGDIRRLVAAGDHLIAVSMEGNVYVLGEAREEEPITLTTPAVKLPAPSAEITAKVDRVLDQVGSQTGYALMFGVDDLQLTQALVQRSEFQISAIDPRASGIDDLRRSWDLYGWYGRRITGHVGDSVSYQAPPYIAHLVVLNTSPQRKQVGPSDTQTPTNSEAKSNETHSLAIRASIAAAYRSVRPYGGVLWLPATSEAGATELAAIVTESLAAEKPHIETTADGVMAIRRGSLLGSGSWTHQYGNAANTLMSADSRIKAPVGVLWFGGNSNLDVLPRHGHGPPEQVIGGRLFLEGMNTLSARDVYTGRVIWRREFEKLDTHGVYYDNSYRDTPLSTAYNQKHIYGANARGTNFVATTDSVYLVLEDKCLRLDPDTGETLDTITLPAGGEENKEWGFVAVMGDVLLAGDGFADYSQLVGDDKGRGRSIVDLSASHALIGFDRHTGKQLWRVESQHSFLHNGIAAGGEHVFLLDRLPKSVEERLKRRGKEPAPYRVAAVEIATGKVAWESKENIFGSFLSYSAEHGMLLESGAKAKDRSSEEVGQGMTVYQADSGEVVWTKPDLKYTGPCILHHATIITGVDSYRDSAGAFSLLTGAPRLLRNPLTGVEQPWKITRAYGCNYPIACENLLTFRSGAAGFYDLTGHSGSGNLGGFKSGCTSNLVVADGVLNAPDYTRTCSCAYQNQTSLALVHMPELEMWTFSKLDSPDGKRVRSVGINFGAPGDRRSADGTLWLEYPTVGGDSPDVAVKVEGDSPSYFRRHATQVASTGDASTAWVASSGVEGVRRVELELSEDPDGGVYRVQLHFAEPDGATVANQRVFHIEVQGNRVRTDFDPHAEAGGSLRETIVAIDNVEVGETLKIDLIPSDGAKLPPVLSGVSAVIESAQ